jgi:hypothetical protein
MARTPGNESNRSQFLGVLGLLPMATDDFFRARLDTMIDLRHPLAVLATRMPWTEIEAALAPAFAHRDRAGRLVEGADLFGPTVQLAGAGVSNAGRPRLPLRLMVSLLYLKHAFNLSDEELVERWSENVVWQFFSGMTYYEPRLPCDATQLGRLRRVLGEAGVEQLLKSTIEAAVEMGAVRKTEFERVIVDTTVQEKAAVHPTDSRLLEVARDKIARLAKRAGIKLKLTHEREGKTLRRRAAGYAHARQFRRLKKVLRRQRTILGSVLREVQRKLGQLDEATREHLVPWLERADHIRSQRPHDQGKLYALHAPEVECIGLGLVRASPSSSASRSAWWSRTGTAWWSVPGPSPATRTTATRWPSSSSRRATCCKTSASSPRRRSSTWAIAASTTRCRSRSSTEARARPSRRSSAAGSGAVRPSSRPSGTPRATTA